MGFARAGWSYRRVLTMAATFVVALTPGARAQGTITGRVTAAETNAPLVDVRLIVVGTNAAATTSAIAGMSSGCSTRMSTSGV